MIMLFVFSDLSNLLDGCNRVPYGRVCCSVRLLAVSPRVHASAETGKDMEYVHSIRHFHNTSAVYDICGISAAAVHQLPLGSKDGG